MTLPEAIKLLQEDIDNPGSVDIMDVNKAEKLGIEALKLLKEMDAYGDFPSGYQLPGETK